jgi:PKD repeat protein
MGQSLANNCEAFFNFSISENGLVEFNNESYTNCDSWSYDWQFGDEGSSDSANPSWEFSPGEYTVCLTIITPTCEDDYCTTLSIPGDCTEFNVSLESIIDPGTVVTLNWLLEEFGGEALEDGVLEIILGGASGELNLCLPDGCYSLSFTGPEEFSFEILLIYLALAELDLEPFNVSLDGNTLSLDFSVNSDCIGGDDCPENYGFGPQEECGCFNMEIGSFVEGENVFWQFGDGTVEEGGHFADHCYEEDGVYTVTAIYSSPTCNQEAYTFTIEVNCANDCPEGMWAEASNECQQWDFEIGSFVEGESVDWYVNEDLYAENQGHFFQIYFEEPGEYTVCGEYTSPACPEGATYCTSFVVEACEEDCTLDVALVSSQCGSYLWEAYNYPDGAQIHWEIDEQYVEVGNLFDWTFLDSGEHTLCVYYETPDCPNGVFWCETYAVELCGNDCPEEIYMAQNGDCGCYQFEIGSFAEGEEVDWDFGDGTTVTGGHFIEHCYEDNGEYIVTAWYTSNSCEGMLYTLGMADVDCGEGDCDLSVSFDQVDNNSFVFYADAPDGVSVWWDMGNGNEETGFVVDQSYDIGWFTVCAFYESPDCPEGTTVCVDIYVEDEGGDCPQDIYMAAQGDCGCYVFEIGSFAEGENVSWDFGDGTYLEGGHFAQHCYEDDGFYVVTAWYESNACAGALYTLGVAQVDCVEENCPDSVWMNEGNNCGCYAFEIGSFAEGEVVVWNFGDGVSVTGGHFIEHCFEVDGEYVITAFYTSNSCPGETYTLGVANVNCDEECTEVNIAMDSFVGGGGPAFVEYTVTEVGGDIQLSGICQYNIEVAYHDIFGCLENGCYEVDIWSDTPLDIGEAFFTSASANGSPLTIVDGPNYDGEYHLSYTFSLNGDCGEEECNIELDLSAIECGWMLFSAYGVPNEVNVTWTIDGEFASIGGPQEDFVFEDDAVHIVCASYTTPDCPDGVSSCVEVQAESCNDCPDSVYEAELDDCGCFEFEVGSFVEGECVTWDFGDGTVATCEGHYIQHCYTESGVYVVHITYVSSLCPEGVELVQTIQFDCEECTEVGFAFDSFLDVGGPAAVEWSLSDGDGTVVVDGFCQYNENNGFCDASACLEDGCYEMNIWASTAINSNDLFFAGAFMNGNQLDYVEGPIYDGEHHLTYTFSVNGDCDVSIDIDKQPIYAVYPVPTADNLIIFTESYSSNTYLQLYDVYGNLITSSRMTGKQETLALNSLANGMYTLVIRTDNSVITKKVQVLK